MEATALVAMAPWDGGWPRRLVGATARGWRLVVVQAVVENFQEVACRNHGSHCRARTLRTQSPLLHRRNRHQMSSCIRPSTYPAAMAVMEV